MKKNIILILISIVGGIIFTFFFLNKGVFYAKEEYVVYAFQVGAFESLDNAERFSKKIESSIIIKENNLYKVYTAIYKDIDLVNEMVSYFESKNINIYLKMLKVSKNFYENLDSYEKLVTNASDNVFNKINQSILDLYLESRAYEENN